MTMDEIKNCNKDCLVPSDIAEVMGVHPYSINRQAREDATALGFPVSRTGTRILIPRRAFIAFMEGGEL